jgi:uncharacterized protein with GYD domain
LKLIGGYYTFGEYDVVIIIEAPNDEAVISLMLKVGSAGTQDCSKISSQSWPFPLLR